MNYDTSGQPPVHNLPGRDSFFPTGKQELLFALGILASALALCNFTLFGGYHLGFSIAAIACILCSCGYLLAQGRKITPYSAALLGLSAVIAAGFGRSDDSFVKSVMLLFLFFSVNLGLALLAGQNQRSTAGISCLGDAFYSFYNLGIGRLPQSFRGLKQAFQNGGAAVKKGSAVLAGLVIAIPILAVMIPLLIRADAAFDGLLQLLPDFDFFELVVTAIFGFGLWCVLYTRGVALRHTPQETPRQTAVRKGISAITVNTVLCSVNLLYAVYLLSQLAYFAGGFAGILPEEYTFAEYARRGFFEMAMLCAIDLGIIGLSLGLVKKEGRAPFSTRLLCLGICAVTLFFVAAASSKMFLYISSYGLTRLRLLTQIIMLFMALVTVFVAIWLFVPRLPYMNVILLAGLIIGSLTLWADVDTQVAAYNVNAYIGGKLETVDLTYLCSLSDGAVPHICRLTEEAPEQAVADMAKRMLKNRSHFPGEDFRSWNYVNYLADQYLTEEVRQT